ncbi:Nuclear receptor subfamily 2 group E member 1 [Zootermopsis nevadensis]|uniref:Nuclear receptor subfamily 2 group E member 1 n=2 Tax=Zootermopsis nevadensis TaxID=136037 RepID=A0A067R6X7_ZOONE|nr:Nuclear receptor subfamily 2 group E member 1 [Zootermopsis nevadensis]
MALYFKEPNSPPHGDLSGVLGVASVSRLLQSPPPQPPPSHPAVLDLALPKAPHPELPHPLYHANPFFCSPVAVAVPKFPLGPILTSPFPSHTTETLCESAARLLFMNVKWTKNVPAFTALDFQDQLLMLEQSWRELFVLGAAQYLLPLDIGQLMSLRGALVDRDSAKEASLLHEIKVFHSTVTKFKDHNVDPYEYACLRAIVLFRATDVDSGSSSASSNKNSTTGIDRRTLANPATVATLQDHTQYTLKKYNDTVHPRDPVRFGKLLLLLPTLRTVSAATIEELFFRRTIGDIPIERIICDMYKTTDI